MDVLHLAKQLIAIKSITDSAEESRPISLITSLLKAHDIRYQVIGKGTKLNLVSEIGSGPATVMLNSHFDVVPGTAKHFQPKIMGKLLVGRGSSDAKGPLSAMIMAFIGLSKKKFKEKIILCCVCDEENAGAWGTNQLVRRGINARYSLFGEPTDFKVIIAEKGFLRLKIKVFGKEAHAAFPQNGLNAIIIMSKIIREIHKLGFSSSHHLLGKPSISLGIIRGGRKVNIVAGECEMDIDIRYVPGQIKDEIIDRIKFIVGKFGEGLVEVISYGEPCETKSSSPLVKIACRAFRSSVYGVNFATDARFYQGNDFIICGPGKPDMAHQEEENVELAHLFRAEQLYKKTILELIS